MVSKFDDTLRLLKPTETVAGHRAGVCAMGLIDEGETIVSMEVWIFQESTGAIATGRSGDDVGSDRERPPFVAPANVKGQWMVRIGLDDDCPEFKRDEMAKAAAVALVEHPNGGGREIQHWDQDVLLDPAHHRPPPPSA